jgi:hypothetical protein
VLNWWDGVELWLVQLPYPFAVTLFLAVLLPLCWGVVALIDKGINALVRRRRERGSMLGRERSGDRDTTAS